MNTTKCIGRAVCGNAGRCRFAGFSSAARVAMLGLGLPPYRAGSCCRCRRYCCATVHKNAGGGGYVSHDTEGSAAIPRGSDTCG